MNLEHGVVVNESQLTILGETKSGESFWTAKTHLGAVRLNKLAGDIRNPCRSQG